MVVKMDVEFSTGLSIVWSPTQRNCLRVCCWRCVDQTRMCTKRFLNIKKKLTPVLAKKVSTFQKLCLYLKNLAVGFIWVHNLKVGSWVRGSGTLTHCNGYFDKITMEIGCGVEVGQRSK